MNRMKGIVNYILNTYRLQMKDRNKYDHRLLEKIAKETFESEIEKKHINSSIQLRYLIEKLDNEKKRIYGKESNSNDNPGEMLDALVNGSPNEKLKINTVIYYPKEKSFGEIFIREYLLTNKESNSVCICEDFRLIEKIYDSYPITYYPYRENINEHIEIYHLHNNNIDNIYYRDVKNNLYTYKQLPEKKMMNIYILHYPSSFFMFDKDRIKLVENIFKDISMHLSNNGILIIENEGNKKIQEDIEKSAKFGLYPYFIAFKTAAPYVVILKKKKNSKCSFFRIPDKNTEYEEESAVKDYFSNKLNMYLFTLNFSERIGFDFYKNRKIYMKNMIDSQQYDSSYKAYSFSDINKSNGDVNNKIIEIVNPTALYNF